MTQLPGNVCLGPIDLDRESILNVAEFVRMLSSVGTGEELSMLLDVFGSLVMMQTTFTVAERATMVSLFVDLLSSGIGVYPVSLVVELLKAISTLCSAEPPLPISVPWRVTFDCVDTYAFSTRAVGDIGSLSKEFFNNAAQDLMCISAYYDPEDYEQIYALVHGYLKDTSAPTNLFKYLALTRCWLPVLPSAHLRAKYVKAHCQQKSETDFRSSIVEKAQFLLPGTFVDSSVADLLSVDLSFHRSTEQLHTSCLRDLEDLLHLSLGKEVGYSILYSIYRLLVDCPYLDISESSSSILFSFQTTPVETSSQFSKSCSYFTSEGRKGVLSSLSLPDWFEFWPAGMSEAVLTISQASVWRPSLLWCLVQAGACRSRYLYLQGMLPNTTPSPPNELTKEYVDLSPAISMLRYIVNACFVGDLPKCSVIKDVSMLLTDLSSARVLPDEKHQQDLQARIVHFVKGPLAHILYLPVTSASLKAITPLGSSLAKTLLLQLYIDGASPDTVDLFQDALIKAVNLFSADTWPMITQMAYELAHIDATKKHHKYGLSSLLFIVSDQLLDRWFISSDTTGLTLPEALAMCLPYLTLQHVVQSKACLLFLESVSLSLPVLTAKDLCQKVGCYTSSKYDTLKDLLFAVLDSLLAFLLDASVETLASCDADPLSAVRSPQTERVKSPTNHGEYGVAFSSKNTTRIFSPSFGTVTGTNKFAPHLATAEKVIVSILAALDTSTTCEIFSKQLLPFLFDKVIPRRVASFRSFLSACIAGLESRCNHSADEAKMVHLVLDTLYDGLDEHIRAWLEKSDTTKSPTVALICLQAVISVDHLLLSPAGETRLNTLGSRILEYFCAEEYRSYCEVSERIALLQKNKTADPFPSCPDQDDELEPAKKKFTYIVCLAHALSTPCVTAFPSSWTPCLDGDIREVAWSVPTDASIELYQSIISAVSEGLSICTNITTSTDISYALLSLLTPHVQGNRVSAPVDVPIDSYKLQTLLDCLDIRQTMISPSIRTLVPPAEKLVTTDFTDETPGTLSSDEPRFPLFFTFSGCGGGMMQESMRLLSEPSCKPGAVRALFAPSPQLANKRRPIPVTSHKIQVDSELVFATLRKIANHLLKEGLFVGKEAQDFLAVLASAGIETKTTAFGKFFTSLFSAIPPKRPRSKTQRTQLELNIVAQMIYYYRLLFKSTTVQQTTQPSALQFIPLVLDTYIFGSTETRVNCLSIMTSLASVAPAHYGAVHTLICDIFAGLLRKPLGGEAVLETLAKYFTDTFGSECADGAAAILRREALAFNPIAARKFIEQLSAYFDKELPVQLIALNIVGGISTEILFEKYLTIYVLLGDHDHEGMDKFFSFVNAYNNSLMTVSATSFAEAVRASVLQEKGTKKDSDFRRVIPIDGPVCLDVQRWMPVCVSGSEFSVEGAYNNITAMAATVHKTIDTICKSSDSVNWHSLCFILVYYIKRFAMLPIPVGVLRQLCSALTENHLVFVDIYLIFYTSVLLAYSYKEHGTMQHPLTSRAMPVTAYSDASLPLVERISPISELKAFLNEQEIIPYLQELIRSTLLVCHEWCEQNDAASKCAIGQQENTIMWRQMFIIGGLGVVKTTLALLIEMVARDSAGSSSAQLKVYEHQMLCNIVWRVFESLPYIRSLSPSIYTIKIHQVMRRLIDLVVSVQERSSFSDIKMYWRGLLTRTMSNGNTEEARVFIEEELKWFVKYISDHTYRGSGKAASRLVVLEGLINGIFIYDAPMAEDVSLRVLGALDKTSPQALSFSRLVVPHIAKILAFCVVAVHRDLLALSKTGASFCGLLRGSNEAHACSSSEEKGLRCVKSLFSRLKAAIAKWIDTDPNSRSEQTLDDIECYHEAALLVTIVHSVSSLRGPTSIIDKYELLETIIHLKGIDVCSNELGDQLNAIVKTYVDTLINPSSQTCETFIRILSTGTLGPREYAFCLGNFSRLVTKYLLTSDHLVSHTTVRSELIEKYFRIPFFTAMGKHNVIKEQGLSAFINIASAMSRDVLRETYDILLQLFKQKDSRQCNGVLSIMILFAKILLLDMSSELPRHLLNLKRLTTSKQPVVRQNATQFYEAFWRKYTYYESVIELVFPEEGDFEALKETKKAVSYVN